MLKSKWERLEHKQKEEQLLIIPIVAVMRALYNDNDNNLKEEPKCDKEIPKLIDRPGHVKNA